MKLTRNHRSLNELGFAHLIAPLLAFIALFAIMGGVFYLLSAHAATADYIFKSGISGKCLDDFRQGKVNGTTIDLYDCNNSSAQKWNINSNGTIENANGLCLDNWQQKNTNGNPIKLYKCSATDPGEQWRINGNILRNPKTGKCVDDPAWSKINGKPLELYTCKGGTNQRWTPTPAGSKTNGGGAKAPAPTPVPVATASCAGAPSAASLTSDPTTVQLQGTEAVDWSEVALCQIGAPLTTANIQTMTTWMLNEGSPHCGNNPLNLIVTGPSSTLCNAMAGAAQIGLQNYPTPAAWTVAFSHEVEESYYPVLLRDLRSGAGLLNSKDPTLESELMFYSGNGYNSIPASYLNGQLGAK